MDGDLLLIFSFILALLVLILPFAYVVNKRSMEHEERKLDLLARKAEAERGTGKGSADYRKLEERVRVLERIATDGNRQLAAQIEELRDLQLIDEETSTARVAP